MLVLGRTEGESLLIGDNILVRVVRVQGNKVRLGIEAPASVNVVRCELVPRKTAAAAAAAKNRGARAATN